MSDAVARSTCTASKLVSGVEINPSSTASRP
jgi:hypothetical protein